MATRRMANYKLCRDKKKDLEEVDWVRVSDMANMIDNLPRPIILINGCFDMLHRGHMKMIFAARDRCKTLICAMDGDNKVTVAKGIGRPIMSWIERATTLNFMPIDYLVEIETNKDFSDLIKVVKPDLRVQGQDHRYHESRYPQYDKLFVHTWGTRTSDIIERCKKL